ncbi:MAG: D-glycero-beta-D-manno-heptose-7-phosphate kinase [Acidobacteriota bacterium]
MKPNRIRGIVDQFKGKRLAVLGDLMLDHFIWGDVRRISPEAPVPVVEVSRESWHLGGAGNVVSNLLELGAVASPIGIVGDDPAAERIRAFCLDAGADASGILTEPSRPTTVKTRILAHSQQVVRFDREDRSYISQGCESRLHDLCALAIDKADGVIVSDYEKGTLTPALLRSAIEHARKKNKFVLVDPKPRNWTSYRGVDVITPNQMEAERATGIEIVDEASVKAAAMSIRNSLGCRNVLITRGERGMSLLDAEGNLAQIPTMAREVYDVTGAGDTVIATLALALSAGAEIKEAAVIANYAAGVVVGKVGTATLSVTELLDAMVN